MQEHATSDLAEETEDQDTQKTSRRLFSQNPREVFGSYRAGSSVFLPRMSKPMWVETDAGTLIYLFFQEGFISLY